MLGLEVRALAEIALGQRRAAAASIELAALAVESDEDRARIEALSGNLEHFAGNAERALAHFRRAAEHAAHAGAVLEEATYLTGVAAEAANVGELVLALEAGLRAVLLFEGVGRQREAARALLSLSSAHASIGARAQAREHAEAALRRARAAGDKRCRGYAHLVLSDVSEPGDREGLEHCASPRRCSSTTATTACASRPGCTNAGTRSTQSNVLDAESGSSERALDVRLEWWAARARVAVSSETPYEPSRVLDALLSLASERAPIALRGPAAFAGAELAAKVGDGDAVRRLTLIAAEAARQLFAHAGPALSALVRGLSWVRTGDSSGGSGFSAEQLADVDRWCARSAVAIGCARCSSRCSMRWCSGPASNAGFCCSARPTVGCGRARRATSARRLTGAQLSLSTSLAERALSRASRWWPSMPPASCRTSTRACMR